MFKPVAWQEFLVGLLLMSAISFTSGCAFNDLNKDLKVISKASKISGSVVHHSKSNKPVIVVLFRVNPETDRNVVAQYLVVYGKREFTFLVAEGDFRIYAFEDTNQDLAFQHNEKVGWYGGPSVIKARNGAAVENLAIELKDPKKARAKLPELYRPETQNYKLRMKDFHLGEVVPLDAPRFSIKTGGRGLWTPVKFLSQEGIGIFFMEPYNPRKIPVLFVHGAGGYPLEWKYLIEHLDKEKYQAWVFQYSSGMRLTWSAEALEMGLQGLHLKYKFPKLYLVAHSMGGLVAKKFIRIYQGDYVKLLVTISTPWDGHEASKMGVDHAPAIIPCWYDMVPGSPFLSSLSAATKNPQPPYYLFFGYKGDSGMFTKGNDDGSVSLRSMLQPWAQEEALKVYGFDADHSGILSNPETARSLYQVMANSK